MSIKIKLNKSSKCRHCVEVLGSNPDSSPVVSQSPININERSVVKGSAGDDGKEERDFISPFTFPSSPSYQCLIVSRNRSLTAYKIIRDDWGRVSGQIKLEPHPIEQPRSQGSVLRTRLPIEGFNSSFQTYGHGFLVTTIPSPEIYLSGSTEIFSSTFQIKRNSFLFRR